ncbi:MAG: hypothetical protein ACRDWY_10740 [Actinomycetes bacterium]
MTSITSHATRWATATAVAVLVTTITVLPASADRIGPADNPIRHTIAAGSANLVSGNDLSCPLRRIGRQLVRCDNLTGAGVPAPLSVPRL